MQYFSFANSYSYNATLGQSVSYAGLNGGLGAQQAVPQGVNGFTQRNDIQALLQMVIQSVVNQLNGQQSNGYAQQGYGNGNTQQGYAQQGYGYAQQGYGYAQQGYGYAQQGYGYAQQGYGYAQQGYGYAQQGVTYPQANAYAWGGNTQEAIQYNGANNFQALPSYIQTPTGTVIVGTPGDDIIYGTNLSDLIFGLGGNDIIYGLGGDDLIFGGQGNDQLHGGLGDDMLHGGSLNEALAVQPQPQPQPVVQNQGMQQNAMMPEGHQGHAH